MSDELMAREGNKRADGWARFGGGDPRDPTLTPKERDEAAGALLDKRRWHLRNGADWLAVRLQYGRERKTLDVATAFGIGEATVDERARNEGWVRSMGEHDRRDLSRLVWLAGWARLARGETVDFGALRAASEWRVAPKAVEQPLWQPRAAKAENIRANMDMEISDDGYGNGADGDYGIDPKREEREAIRQKLDELLERLEADARDAGQVGAFSDEADGIGVCAEDSGGEGPGVEGVG